MYPVLVVVHERLFDSHLRLLTVLKVPRLDVLPLRCPVERLDEPVLLGSVVQDVLQPQAEATR